MVQSTCSVPICDRPVRARGYCDPHYIWSWKHAGAVPTHILRVHGERRGCSVTGCDRKHQARGFCMQHVKWLYAHGAEPTHRLWPRKDAAEVLRRRTVPEPATGCILWTGSCDRDGYGHLFHEGRLRPAHCVAWELANGPVPAGMELDHVWDRGCRYRSCVNLGHLEPVTHAENVRRKTLH